MTRTTKSTRRLPMVGLALVLGAILAFLYARDPKHDTAAYLSNIAVLRQLKQVDAQWELNVLKSRDGLIVDYDQLVEPWQQLVQLQLQLRENIFAESHTETTSLAAAEDRLAQTVQQKALLIERFKSHNAVLRNSLAYLPTATDEIRRALGTINVANPLQMSDITARVDNLLAEVLVYSREASTDRRTGAEADLFQLGAMRPLSPRSIPKQFEIFEAHVQTVLREQPIVDQLLFDVSKVPTATMIDEISNLLGEEQREGAERSERHRGYLIGFATALAGLLLYAAVCVIRSHAEVNRVNQALLGANATLEQRVEERTRELRAAQSDLMASARLAGMAEIAHDVLHNVGNVLNSVNVSAGVIAARLRESSSRKLAPVVELLRAHSADLGSFFEHDERGRMLPGYLSRLAECAEAEQQALLNEIAALVRSVDHVKEIVAAQQAHSRSACVAEMADIGALLDDALRMSADGLMRHQVTVVKAFEPIPLQLIDKHRLLQIAINLINNAKQAMADVRDRPRRLTVSTKLAAAGEGQQLVVCVADEGEGIAAENLTRIFSHGFTTRRDGHGFGLHSCVLAAKEMGGSLRAHSDGPGRGATFTLELPVATAGGTS